MSQTLSFCFQIVHCRSGYLKSNELPGLPLYSNSLILEHDLSYGANDMWI